jgi:hypothetical protein
MMVDRVFLAVDMRFSPFMGLYQQADTAAA